MAKKTIRLHRPPKATGFQPFCVGVLFGIMLTGFVVSLALFNPGPGMKEWCEEVGFGQGNP